MSLDTVLDTSGLSEAKKALLAKRLRGRTDVQVSSGPPAPTALMLDPERRFAPFKPRSFIAERLRHAEEVTSHFRMFIEAEKVGLDVERYGAAWRELYQICDVMRGTIRDGQLVIAPPNQGFDIIHHDARSMTDTQVAALIDGTRERLRNVVSGPDELPVHVALVQTDDDTFQSFYSFDMRVMDLASVEFLALRCRRIYEGTYEPKGPFFTQDYRRTEEAYLESVDGQDARKHWEKRIAASGPRLRARDLVAPKGGAPDYGYICVNTHRDIWEQGQAHAKALGVSELVAVQVLYADLLAKLSHKNCFAFEIRSFQRLPFHQDIYELLGQFTLGQITSRDTSSPKVFVDRIKDEADKMDRNAPFAFFDAATHWQASEPEEDRGGKFVFTNTCNRFEEFVLAGNIPPMRWFGTYKTILQYNPDTALEYLLVENDGDLENHWFVDHRHLPREWADGAYKILWDALHRLCTDPKAWHVPCVFDYDAAAREADR